MSNTFLGCPIITARRAGQCALTGKRYPVGATIVGLKFKQFTVWAIFNDQTRRTIQAETAKYLDNTGNNAA